MSTKDSNPKDAIGSRKLSFTALPLRALAGASLAMTEGGLKYGRHNYRAIGVRASVYVDAALRHTLAWWEGEDLDPNSGLCHIDKAIASLLVLRDSMLRGNWRDDRPPAVMPGWVEEGNEATERLIASATDPVPPYTELGLRPGSDISF